ncbi:hypothetical protein ACLMJK_004611 [Lecanora helva]
MQDHNGSLHHYRDSTGPSLGSTTNKEYPQEFTWTVRWQFKVTKYKNDLETYIWQPHSRPPPFLYAHVSVCTINQACPRVLLLFSTIRSLGAFRHEYDSPATQFPDNLPTAYGLLRVLHAIYKVAISETQAFLDDISRHVFEKTFQSRVHPSKQKYQHLLFLNDCTERADLDMSHNVWLLDDLTKFLKEYKPANDNVEETNPNDNCAILESPAEVGHACPGPIEFMDKTTGELRAEIERIRDELKTVGKKIEKLRHEVETQNNMQSRNTILVTILAAIYVPLAFVTSFLGMNISEGSVKDWLNITSYGIDANKKNDSSGNASTITNTNDDGTPTPQVQRFDMFVGLTSRSVLTGVFASLLWRSHILRLGVRLLSKPFRLLKDP